MSWDTTPGVDTATAVIPANHQRSFRTQLPNIGNMLTTSGRAYFTYLGLTTREVALARIAYYITTIADTGTQTAEVGYFSTPLAPNRAAQTLTKIAATAALGLTSLKTQQTPLAATIPAGTHLWTAYRGALATTQPTFRGVGYELLDGSLLITSSATALTSGTTYAGILPTDGTSATGIDLAAYMD
jgi:hypothetical protein